MRRNKRIYLSQHECAESLRQLAAEIERGNVPGFSAKMPSTTRVSYGINFYFDHESHRREPGRPKTPLRGIDAGY